MIFLTVGTQLPFDRLVRVVDEWAGKSGRDDVFAQIGPSQLQPKWLRYQTFVAPGEFAKHVAAATLVIAHAGMGSILYALELGKPIIVMPRRSELNEQRNNHQLATARRFRELGRIMVAMDEVELLSQLQCLQIPSSMPRIGRFATDEMLKSVRQLIEG